MAQICKVCSHQQTDAINREILSGESHLGIAARYGMNHINIRNHAQNHLPKKLATSFQRKEQGELMGLRGQIDELVDKVNTILDRNMEKGTRGGDEVSLRAIAEHRGLLQLLSTTATELHKIKLTELEMQREQQDRESGAVVGDFWEKHYDNLTSEERSVLLAILNKATGYDGNVDALKDIRPVPAEPLFTKRGTKPTQINVPSEGIQEERPSIEEKLVKLYGKEKEDKTDDSFQNVLDKAKEFMTKAEYRQLLKSIE